MRGIRSFREKVRPGYKEKFAHLALGQSPDCLFFGCADSRVVPTVFASTDPGDLFVVRNVGNLVPPCDPSGVPGVDTGEGAAIEFALLTLNVRDVIVCGHSECGAMRAILTEELPAGAPHLGVWLKSGRVSLERQGEKIHFRPSLSPVNQLSQLNVLQQLEHLRSYPVVREREARGELKLHAWWFDLTEAEVLIFDEGRRSFEEIGGEENSL